METHRPVMGDRNKKTVFDIACPTGVSHHGELSFAQWDSLDWSVAAKPRQTAVVECRSDVFDYESSQDERVDWYLNFADKYLFAFYDGPLFAQDEIQVAEHPVLGALREKLIFEGVQPLTELEDRSTPCTITGAPRRCAIEIGPTERRPNGLYGNEFATASTEDVINATTALDPPTVSNILAMAAPAGGFDAYDHDDVNRIMTILMTGFSAAARESFRLSSSKKVVVHTGFWGCGVFGGNRILTPALQIVAAHWAGLDKLIFHAVNPEGKSSFKKAQEFAEQWLSNHSATIDFDAFVDVIADLRFGWGMGDGN
jgi:hypothetical protein